MGGNGGPAAGRRASVLRAAEPVYERLNQILAKADFDAFVESLCAPFYSPDGHDADLPG